MEQSLTEQLEYIKQQIKFHTSQSKRKQFKGQDTNASLKHGEAVNILYKIKESLKSISSGNLDNAPTEQENYDNVEDLFSISASDIDSFPDEFKEVLSLQKNEILDVQIVELLKIANRPLDIKELILGLYRKFGYQIPKRNAFASKLYRMKEDNLITSIKKGQYILPNNNNENQD